MSCDKLLYVKHSICKTYFFEVQGFDNRVVSFSCTLLITRVLVRVILTIYPSTSCFPSPDIPLLQLTFSKPPKGKIGILQERSGTWKRRTMVYQRSKEDALLLNP